MVAPRARFVAHLALTIGIILVFSGIARADAAQTWNNLNAQFDRLFKAGRFGDAEVLARRMVSLAERSLTNQPMVLAKSLFNLACCHGRQFKFKEQEPLLKRAIEISERVLGEENVAVAPFLEALATSYMQQRENSQAAEAVIKRALRIRAKAEGVAGQGRE